jgi:hypothetical protein
VTVAFPRSREAEILDRPGNSEADLSGALGDFRWINRWLGGNSSVLRGVEGLLGDRLPRDLSVLDAGTGGGDVPRALIAWGLRRGVRVRAIGLDLEPVICRIARRLCADERRVQVVRGDARRLPLADGGVDIVVATLFTHHFSEAEVVALLAEFSRTARVGVVVSDLERARVWAWSFAALARLVRAHPMVRNDGPLSVRRGFTRRELADLARRAGLVGGVHRTWAGRLVIAAPTSRGDGGPP